ncbi:PTS system D-galactosamine-specific EIIC component (Man family) [Mobilisporobacter senegalensis]|uniref:PTS system D-galactosamine-specific EIIC component (Man family) n=1 Tax=Mobilisporobacter senegalensis TaxID=1329262 RepID=A0A3N1X810_9FIRM|nr:PTS galactosamine transporter subunit IIC [Mobilisporobacter senegalensis]ROR22171.1 PTS system D-galactosamine-specific EIIC component (Man family) [Mobilisporobacter senegalensis]
MEITLLQGIALTIMAIIVGIDFWLEGLFIFRPIIVCTLTGIILGDVQIGLITGGLTELAFAGLTPAGGTQPPNPVLAGVMTTVIAHSTGSDAATSVALALPFSFLMQYIILFFYSSFSLFMRRADECANNADAKGLFKLNMLTTIIVGVTYGVVVFLCAYVAQDGMQALVQAMPEWLTHGFQVAGGILPAVGFGMLLKVMLKIEYVPYLLIGFLMACFLTLSNLLPVAIAGAALALIGFNRDKDIAKLLSNITVSKGDEEDGI